MRADKMAWIVICAVALSSCAGDSSDGSDLDGSTVDETSQEVAIPDLPSPGEWGPEEEMEGEVIEGVFVQYAKETLSKNTIDSQDTQAGFLDSNQRGLFQVSSCNQWGVVYRTVEKTDNTRVERLVFSQMDVSGKTETETVIAPDASEAVNLEFSLVYDGNCNPLIYQTAEGVYRVWQRDSGQWSKEELDLSPVETSVGGFDTLKHFQALTGSDGTVHLVFRIRNGQKRPRYVHWKQGEGGFIRSPEPLDADIRARFQYALDGDDNLHAVFNIERDLYYGLLAKDTWQIEPVAIKDNQDTEAAYSASIALDSDDAPSIASSYRQRNKDGSFDYARLMYHSRMDSGVWRSRTLLTESDGYQGTDGNGFTGADPHLMFDGSGRPHIVFSDIASWHNDNGYNEYLDGQIRHVFFDSQVWRHSTVVSQTGQDNQDNPLEQMLFPTLSIGGTGETLAVIGVARRVMGPSLAYPSVAVEIEQRLVFVTGTVGH